MTPPSVAPAPSAAARPWHQSHALAALLLTILCAVLYLRTTDYPMVFDDNMYLTDSPIFRDASNFSYPLHFTEFMRRPEQMGADPDYAINFVLRPVAYGTFYLNYMFDGFQPRWFRVVNILLHTGNALLLYALVHLLLRNAAGRAVPALSRQFIALTAAALFAAHPMAVESVTYIVQRFTSQAAFFYLLALVLYFVSVTAARHRGLLRVAAVVVTLLGMLTKECTVTLPLMALLLDRLVLGTPVRKAAWRALPLLLCLPVIPALVLLSSATLNEGTLSLDAARNIVNSRDEPLAHWSYLMTQITVVAAYLRLLAWPSGLNLDPEWPVYHTLGAWPVLTALGALLAFVAIITWLRRRAGDDARMRAAFAFMLWFFATILVSSGLVPLPDMMAEHRAYLPSAGIFVLAAILLDLALRSLPKPKLAAWAPTAAAMVITLALATATWARNDVWSSTYSLWKDTAEKSPGKFRVWSNLGAAAAEVGRDQEALECFQKSLQIEPRFQNGMFNLANSLLRLGRVQESVTTMERMMKLNEMADRNPMALYQLGVGLARLGRHDDAIITLHKCLRLLPDHAGAHLVLALIRRDQRQHQLSLHHFREVLRIQGQNQEVARAIAEIERMPGVSQAR
ncbi:MAG: tetratricopeptide repeat protein [Verrucomicrobiaceae bacterium]|nr:tetratricopeptide repeat protein [Verrucomicrobiaceae bacterium]